MPLDDIERPAENIGKRARLLDVARFQVDSNDDIRA